MKNNEQTEDECPECGGKMDDYAACFYGHCNECELKLFLGAEYSELWKVDQNQKQSSF